MPYVTTWEPNPKDPNLPVLSDLPEWAELVTFSIGCQCANGRDSQDQWRQFYHCPICHGWIEGEPFTYPVNDLNPRMLAGRMGTEYACRRCGGRIGFNGVMS